MRYLPERISQPATGKTFNKRKVKEWNRRNKCEDDDFTEEMYGNSRALGKLFLEKNKAVGSLFFHFSQLEIQIQIQIMF